MCPGRTWQHVNADAAGWSSEGLRRANAVARGLGTDSFVVIQGGKLIWRYGTPSQPTNIHSVRKSIASILFGIAHDTGTMRLDTTLGQLGVDDHKRLSATEKTATVRDLLSARSCIYHEAAYETQEMEEKRPERHSCRPGERWFYNNWDFNALGTIYGLQTGRSLFDALDEQLARPLGFEDFNKSAHTRFHTEPASRHPAYLINLSALDLARIGLLMARGGDWCGRRIVSKAWVAESTSAISQTDRSTGYGYMWWVADNGRQFRVQFEGKTFSARGSRGQFLIVNPATDLVIVHRVDSGVRGKKVGSRDFGELLATIMAARL